METSGTGLIFIFLTAWFLQFVSAQALIYTKSCHILGAEGQFDRFAKYITWEKRMISELSEQSIDCKKCGL